MASLCLAQHAKNHTSEEYKNYNSQMSSIAGHESSVLSILVTPSKCRVCIVSCNYPGHPIPMCPPCGVDQVYIGGRFTWLRQSRGFDSYLVLVLICFIQIWCSILVVAIREHVCVCAQPVYLQICVILLQRACTRICTYVQSHGVCVCVRVCLCPRMHTYLGAHPVHVLHICLVLLRRAYTWYMVHGCDCRERMLPCKVK